MSGPQLTLPTDEARLKRVAELAAILSAFPREVQTIIAAVAAETRSDDPDPDKIGPLFDRLGAALLIALPMGAELASLVIVPGTEGTVQ